jgi:hypothetical protein
MNYALRCDCGQVRGWLDTGHPAVRARCYCRDCQAYARWLGREADMLDPHGGTEIIAALPRHLRFDAGIDRLASVSLTEKGPLRWYARCCRTAIGNTPRSPGIAYVGVVRSCLPGPSAALDEAVGPLKTALNTGSARGQVASTPVGAAWGVLKVVRNVVGARLSGRYRDNPFFRPDADASNAVPITTPHELTPGERQAIYSVD